MVNLTIGRDDIYFIATILSIYQIFLSVNPNGFIWQMEITLCFWLHRILHMLLHSTTYTLFSEVRTTRNQITSNPDYGVVDVWPTTKPKPDFI